MSNFEYIIASLPFLTLDYEYEDGHKWESVIEEIKDNLGERDTEVLDTLLAGFKEENLNADFYAKALSHPVKFIREYFRYDLNLRNAKVSYINNALGRAAGQDILDGRGEETDEGLDIDGFRFTGGEFKEEAKVNIWLKDKDMEWSSTPDFYFYIDVKAKPQVKAKNRKL